MSIPGDISRNMEDGLLGRQSELTAGDKIKEGMAQSMGLAIAERLRWREDTQNGRYPDKNMVSPDKAGDKSAFYRDAKKRLFDDKSSGRTEIEEPQVGEEDEFV